MVEVVRFRRGRALGRSLIAKLLPRRDVRLGRLNVVVLVVRDRFYQGFLVQQLMGGFIYKFTFAVSSVIAVATAVAAAMIVRVVMIVTMVVALGGMLLGRRLLMLLVLLLVLLLVVLHVLDIGRLAQLDVRKDRCYFHRFLDAERI